MKHPKILVALLASSLASAGCGHCDPTELLVYWTFTTATGQATTSCSAAGVSTLVVSIDGQALPDAFTGSQTLRCVDYDASGGVIVPVASGNHTVQIDAFDASGALVYQAAPSANGVNVRSCGGTVVNVDVPAVSGSLSLQLGGFTSCPNPGYVWYALTDLSTNQRIDLVNGLNTPTALACGGTVPLLSSLPFGSYRIEFVEVVTVVNSAYVPRFANCTPQQFTHSANDAVPVTLAATAVDCPGSTGP